MMKNSEAAELEIDTYQERECADFIGLIVIAMHYYVAIVHSSFPQFVSRQINF